MFNFIEIHILCAGNFSSRGSLMIKASNSNGTQDKLYAIPVNPPICGWEDFQNSLGKQVKFT